MRLSLLSLSFLSFLSLVPLAFGEVYPQLKNTKNKPPHVIPFEESESLPISCIQRQIDNGEHKFNEKGNIIYDYFPTCRETGDFLKLKYGISQDINCTIELTDEIYHLFQLYIHQDVPFSCRLPFSKSKDEVFIPLTLNFRGILETSHLDIDTRMNIIIHKGSQTGSIISSIGYSAGGNVSRYIIGDFMPIRFHITWFDEYHKTMDLNHFDLKLGFNLKTIFFLILISGIIIGLIVLVSLYGIFNKKLIKELGYKPGFNTELGIDKRD